MSCTNHGSAQTTLAGRRPWQRRPSTLSHAAAAPFSSAFVVAVVEDGIFAARRLYLRIKRDDQVWHPELADVGHLQNSRKLSAPNQELF